MAKKKKKSVQPRTLVALVQDKSGSMSYRRDATISGANEYIDTLKKEGEGEVLVTLTQFDERVRDVFTARPLDSIYPFTAKDYVPGGMTALNDAIGRTIRTIEAEERKDDRVLMVIMTDGFENSSKEWTKNSILKLIEEKREDGWEFVYLGAGEESWAGAQNLGFKKDQTISYGRRAGAHTEAIYDVAMANVSVTKHARGAGASYAYLAASPIKKRLEDEAQQETTRR